MKTGIFIRSYDKDIAWLFYCLASIRKYCTGFSDLIVCTVKGNPQVEVLAKRHGAKFFIDNEAAEIESGYINQQLSKLRADVMTGGLSDHLIYVDSDCVFIDKCSPATFFEGDKPVILRTSYSSLGDTVPWQQSTEKAVGKKCVFEFMRRHPLCHPVDVIREAREHVERVHNMTIVQYLQQLNGAAFSEFNVIGAYAWHFRRERYHWIDTNKDPESAWRKPPLRQFWSPGGITSAVKMEMQRYGLS